MARRHPAVPWIVALLALAGLAAAPFLLYVVITATMFPAMLGVGAIGACMALVALVGLAAGLGAGIGTTALLRVLRRGLVSHRSGHA